MIGFYGLIEDWVDLEAIRHMAAARPAWSFLMIGEVKTDTSAVSKLPNVHFTGRREYETLPGYCKKFDIAVLLNGRLAPDQKPFIYQVQSACDYLKAAAGWLSGQAPPKHPDTEQTMGELRARIQKTLAFVDTVQEAQYAGATEREVSLPWAPGKTLAGDDYLIQITIPNTYFHLTMAYAILRRNGVDVGKMDFLGPIHWR